MFFRRLEFVQTALVLATVLTPGMACEAAANPTGPAAQAVVPSDRITLPDTKREFHSSSGRFNFVVSTRDGWKSLRGTGDLFSVNGPTTKLLWSRELPQQFGPRFALVNDLGTVLMLDEWININSQYAVLLIDRDNRTVKQHSADAIQAAIQVPTNEIVRMAKHGWWITAPPSVNSSGDAARVKTAGKILTIRFSDGQLSVN